MKSPSVSHLTLLLCLVVSVGLLSAWPSASVTAETTCNDAPASAQHSSNQQSSNQSSANLPCAKQENAFSLMLPFVFGGTQNQNPQIPVDGTATPGQTSQPTGQPTDQSTLVPILQPTDTGQSTATPMPATTTSPTTTLPPTATPTAPPISDELLFDPPSISTLTQTESGVTLSWVGCEAATAFRVLHGPSGQRPASLETTDSEVTLASVSALGEQRYVVECYDDVGNSVFSAPSTLEVTQ